MKPILLALVLVATGLALVITPRIPQDPAYHVMADQRSLAGMPNALNVLSNLPFAVVGILGLVTIFAPSRYPLFRNSWQRWPYAALFGGVALTALGSSYYHLEPTNDRLVWDRLPMTVGFMGLLASVIAERVSIRASKALFGPLLAVGAGSVWYWHATELSGSGDLRAYLLVQFGSLVAVVVLLIVGRPHPGRLYLVAGLTAYAGAKVLEVADRQILAVSGIISGHTLKHLVAAAGVAFLVAMLRARVAPRLSPEVRVH